MNTSEEQPITTSTPPRRRFPQFSLRTLMIAMLALGCLMGFIGIRIKQLHDCQAAVAHLVANGHRVVNDQRGHATQVYFTKNYQATDTDLAILGKITTLEELYVPGPQVTDAGISQLRNLTRLKKLKITSKQVTDEGLDFLSRLTNLTTLILNDTKLTDATLPKLHRLKQLEFLVLRGTKVTDEGVIHLQYLPNLTKVDVSETAVTHKGVMKLEELFPDINLGSFTLHDPSYHDMTTGQSWGGTWGGS